MSVDGKVVFKILTVDGIVNDVNRISKHDKSSIDVTFDGISRSP